MRGENKTHFPGFQENEYIMTELVVSYAFRSLLIDEMYLCVLA